MTASTRSAQFMARCSTEALRRRPGMRVWPLLTASVDRERSGKVRQIADRRGVASRKNLLRNGRIAPSCPFRSTRVVAYPDLMKYERLAHLMMRRVATVAMLTSLALGGLACGEGTVG